MKKKKNLSIITNTIFGSLLIFNTGCGNNNTDNSLIVEGKAVDGYLKEAFVFVDINKNNIIDKNEPFVKTDTSGNYLLDLSKLSSTDIKNANIVVTGGTDISTNGKFVGILKTPLDISTTIENINPLSTIVALKIENNSNLSLNEAYKDVANTLNISVNDIKSDLLANSNKKVYEKALKLQKSLETMLLSLKQDDINEDSLNQIISKISDKFNGTSNNIEGIINSVDFSDKYPDLESIKNNIAEIVSNINLNNLDNDSISMVQTNIEEKRKEFLNEIKKLKTLHKSLDNFDMSKLNEKFNNIDNYFTKDNKKIINFLYGLNLKLNDLLLDEPDLINKLKNLNINNLTNYSNIIENINKSDISDNLKELLIEACNLKIDENEINIDNVKDKKTLKFLVKLKLKLLAKDKEILEKLTSIGVDSDKTIEDNINLILNSNLGNFTKTTITTALEGIKNIKEDKFISLVNVVFVDSGYSDNDLYDMLKSFNIKFSLNTNNEEFLTLLREQIELANEVIDGDGKGTLSSILDDYLNID